MRYPWLLKRHPLLTATVTFLLVFVGWGLFSDWKQKQQTKALEACVVEGSTRYAGVKVLCRKVTDVRGLQAERSQYARMCMRVTQQYFDEL